MEQEAGKGSRAGRSHQAAGNLLRPRVLGSLKASCTAGHLREARDTKLKCVHHMRVRVRVPWVDGIQAL